MNEVKPRKSMTERLLKAGPAIGATIGGAYMLKKRGLTGGLRHASVGGLEGAMTGASLGWLPDIYAEGANSMKTAGLSIPAVHSFWEELEKISALSPGQRSYRKRNKNYFGGEKKVPITAEETKAYGKRLRAAGLRSSISGPYSALPASLAKTEKGFCAYTHRACTKWYPSIEAIPVDRLKFIASTG